MQPYLIHDAIQDLGLDLNPPDITERRNIALTSIAGGLVSRGMPAAEIETTLLAVNGTRCDPPLPENEVTTIAQGILRYDPGHTLTDTGNALRLADAFGTTLKY